MIQSLCTALSVYDITQKMNCIGFIFIHTAQHHSPYPTDQAQRPSNQILISFGCCQGSLAIHLHSPFGRHETLREGGNGIRIVQDVATVTTHVLIKSVGIPNVRVIVSYKVKYLEIKSVESSVLIMDGVFKTTNKYCRE